MAKGLDTEEGTPYTAEDGTCKKRSNGKAKATIASLIDDSDDFKYNDKVLDDMIAVGFHAAKHSHRGGARLGLTGWEKLPENKYQPLIEAVATIGPVAVSVAA